MSELKQLVDEVAQARSRFLELILDVSHEQAIFKPQPTTWSILEITEHIVRAEEAGVSGMWRALDAYRQGNVLWSGDPVHKGMSIEEVIAQTWNLKENVPDIAAPRWGGSLSYWVATLRSKQDVLVGLSQALSGLALEDIIYPHPISGPLDVRQRLAFLGFHLDRHRQQVLVLKSDPDYPK